MLFGFARVSVGNHLDNCRTPSEGRIDSRVMLTPLLVQPPLAAASFLQLPRALYRKKLVDFSGQLHKATATMPVRMLAGSAPKNCFVGQALDKLHA